MTFSLNEIEVMAKRAARGSGLSWGLAEEAAKAVRWLTAHHMPGSKILLDVLRHHDGEQPMVGGPVSMDGIWRAKQELLCPFATGAALCDGAKKIQTDRGIVTGPILQPLALIPFAVTAVSITGTSLQLQWDDIVVAVDGRRAETLSGDLQNAAQITGTLRCAVTEHIIGDPPAGASRGTVDAGIWSGLSDFAQRTFAPATEASRLAGAGAGLTDND